MLGGIEVGPNLHHGKSELQPKRRVWGIGSNSNWVTGTWGGRAELGQQSLAEGGTVSGVCVTL